MEDSFDLPVVYKGEEVLFPARLLQTGYTHRFEVDIYGKPVYFEPDEEGNYRALVDTDGEGKEVPLELLKAIAAGIEAVLK